jgi:hypothetical protein
VFPGFANIAKPLTKLTEKKKTLQRTPEVEVAFETLKETLLYCRILAYPQPRGRFFFERNIKTVEEQLQKVVASHQRDWNARLPVCLLAYRACTHDTTGLTPASVALGIELRPHCDLLFWAPSTRNNLQSITRQFSGPSTQHPKLCPPTPVAGQWPDGNLLRQTGQLHEGDKLWFYRPTRTKGKSPKLQS